MDVIAVSNGLFVEPYCLPFPDKRCLNFQNIWRNGCTEFTAMNMGYGISGIEYFGR